MVGPLRNPCIQRSYLADTDRPAGELARSAGLHTSVGATAIRRFLRPLTWQNAPQAGLPPELRDGPADLPRRVDGRFEPHPRRRPS
ncbi:hypothetical protein BJF78_22450 [Pseudonocardia sp. CNS-139]|nr:hypothetical protein BJF78_22450 [Pseudonocardia sp. CNS-139]